METSEKVALTMNSDPKNDFKEKRTLEKYGSLADKNLAYSIKNLSNPKFLGSIHLKKGINSNYDSIESLLRGEYELKLTKSLKNMVLNPITITLIILALIFNIVWFVLIYLF